MRQRHVGAEQAHPLELHVDGASRVDRLEDADVAGSDPLASPEVLAQDVDEIGVLREGRREGRAVHRVPGGLQLAHHALRLVAFHSRHVVTDGGQGLVQLVRASSTLAWEPVPTKRNTIGDAAQA